MKLAAIALLLAGVMAGCGRPSQDRTTVRVGYFPNITHAQALIGISNRAFQEALGEELRIEPIVLNAGPSAIEALFAGELDISYIGSGPAINGYVKSQGQALRIVAGAASGGAIFVVRPAAGITGPQNLAGKRVATPQLGNTQDIALRHYLTQQGLNSEERGGAVTVLPMQNADILTAFLKGEIDAAWVPEPWGARLIHEAGAALLLDERTLWPGGQFPTAVIVASTRLITERPEVLDRWLKTHATLTQWITDHPDEAKAQVNEELRRLTGKPIAPPVLDEAWSRLTFTTDPLARGLAASAEHAFALGFLGNSAPDLGHLVDARSLNRVLYAQGLTPVPER